MKKLLFLFACTLLVCGVVAQKTISLSLEKRTWEPNEKRYYIHKIRAGEPIVRLAAPLSLQNGCRVLQYSEFQITVQKPTKQRDRTFLRVLVAPCQRQDSVLLVIDENQNDTYADDSLYTIPFNEPFACWDDLYKKLPLITLDSLKVYESSGQTRYKKVNLKLGFSKENGAYFEDMQDFRQDTTFLLDLYTVEYYSATVHSGRDSFEFAVAHNLISPDILGYPGISDSSGAVFFFQHLATKDTALNVIPIGFWNFNNKLVKSTIAIQGTSYKIRSLSIEKKSLELIEERTPLQWKTPVPKAADLTRYSDIIKKGQLTLLEFSGSWCKPCELMFPDVMKLYQTYGKKISFVTVAVEMDPSTAMRYKAQKKIPWKVVYENLNCATAACLKNILKVEGYPSLILFDKKGQILFQQTGTDAFSNITEVMEHALD